MNKTRKNAVAKHRKKDQKFALRRKAGIEPDSAQQRNQVTAAPAGATRSRQAAQPTEDAATETEG